LNLMPAILENSNMMQKLSLMFLMGSSLTSVRSCFLPEENPPFTVGLNTTANTTDMGEDEAQLMDEIEHLRDWESVLEEHFISYLNRETTLEEWIECGSDSLTLNIADGPGSALKVDEYRIVINTFHELTTNFEIKNGSNSAEFIDDHTIEVKYIQITSGQFGFMRGVFPWITALSDADDNDGEIGWEAWQTVRIRINDDGLIQEFSIVSPQFVRQILGAILALYVTTSGPIIQDVESTETLTIFGYNAIVVILLTLISVLTTLVGLCVYLSMQYCARRGSEPVVYRKVEIVTDSEMEQ